jgi:hypothetical protein
MFRETVTMDKHDNEVLAMKLQNGDLSGVKMTGEITDRIFKNGVLVEERHGHNLVVNSFLRLVMCLLKKQSGYTGIQYWAVGSGAASWDGSMPTPDINATQLTAELGRVAIPASEIVFLDSNYDETLTPTNIIQVKHVFGTADCNGVWREFGLFGGNATSNANSGILINKRHHAVLTKTNEMTVERTMRFTLSLA